MKKYLNIIDPSSLGLRQSEVDFISLVIEHIDANLVNPQFSVELLASMLGMTRANLHLRVRTILGLSPVKLIRRIRIEEACRLIEEGTHNMAEIGEMVGFNSASYFTVAFRRVLGCTPGEYAARVASGTRN